MPPKGTYRLPLQTANELQSIETIPASFGHGTASLASRISTLIKHVSSWILPADMINEIECDDYSSDYNDEESEPSSHSDKYNNCSDTVEFEVTMVNMRQILEQQQNFIVVLFRNMKMKPPPSCTKSEVKLQNLPPKWYCGGPRKLETIVGTLCTNFRTYNRQLPGGNTYMVQYMLIHLSHWVNHLDHTKQTMSMNNHVTWGHNQLGNNHTCLHNYNWFVTRIPKE